MLDLNPREHFLETDRANTKDQVKIKHGFLNEVFEMIRNVNFDDADEIVGIYNHYIEHTVITFEVRPVTPEIMRDRIQQITETYPWLVYEREGSIIGYAYASAWKNRDAFRYCTESSIYLNTKAMGQGIGTDLYTNLIERLKASNIHSLIAAIALPNPASIALHHKLGFIKVGHMRETGWKMERWVDVGYWQLLLD